MKMIVLKTFFCLLLLGSWHELHAQDLQKKIFTCVSEYEIFHTIYQDEDGFVWAGTAHSLYRFDGQKFESIRISANLKNSQIIVYCLLKDAPNKYYVATNKGLAMFDRTNHALKYAALTEGYDVRTLCRLADGIYLLGTMTGLLRYDARQNRLQKISEVPSQPVCEIQPALANTYLVTSSNGVYEYSEKECRAILHSIPLVDGKLVMALAWDASKRQLWVGAEDGLYLYHWETKKVEPIIPLMHNTIKKLLLSANGELWAGTDDGLYIYQPQSGTLEHLLHNTRNSASLVNNAIEALFQDKDGNIWIGTNSGASLYCQNNLFMTYSWDDLVGSDEGNRIQSIYEDSRQNLWLAGTNGLGRYNPQRHIRQWFKMSDPNFQIPHNRTHRLYEDTDGDLWLSSDGNISRYDYAKNRFISYQITDSTGKWNANWAYGILEDGKGNLIFSAYLSGLFYVNKHRIKQSGGGVYLADKFCNTGNGSLKSDKVYYMAKDHQGNIWVSTNQNGVHQIFPDGKIVFYTKNSKSYPLHDNNVNDILCDADGMIWIAEETGVDKINPLTGAVTRIAEMPRIVSSLFEMEDCIGMVSGESLYLLQKKGNRMQRIKLDGKRYSCGFWDGRKQCIWLGGIDQCLAIDYKMLKIPQKNTSVLLLASLKIDERTIQVGDTIEGGMVMNRDVNQLDCLTLGYKMNGFSITACENNVRKFSNMTYQYRLDGFNDYWTDVKELPAKLSFYNLSAGDYILQLRVKGNAVPFKELKVYVRAPWYASWWAKLCYMLFFSALAWYLFVQYRAHYRLKIENVKKEKTLEMSKAKMDFLINISHDLKTPLTLIMGALNGLLSEKKNAASRDELSVAYQNSLKINTMIHQALDYKDEDLPSSKYRRVKLEFVEFVRSMVNNMLPVYNEKGIKLDSSVSIDKIYVEADVMELESVVSNLLSNSLKYTLPGGSVQVLVTVDNATVQLEVRDNGVGIPDKDKAKVFTRFFQSDENLKYNNEGSGIGMSLIKKYVERNGGTVDLLSEQGQGTSVFVRFPAVSADETDLKEEDAVESLSVGKYTLLIVEDNEAIADYICQNFKENRVLVAHNGRSGLELAIAHQPDVIITDVMMPVMDGIELLKALKANVHTALIPVILLTAKDNPETEADALLHGADAFVAKPFDAALLKIRVGQLVKGKQRLVSKIREQNLVEKIDEESAGKEASNDEKFLVQINRLIEDNLEYADMNVQRLSELSGYSSKQIYRKLKQLTGRTAVEYIKSIRLKKAAYLLSQRKFTVSEVMYMVGFNNNSYFSRCFTEMYGKTPKQYMQ